MDKSEPLPHLLVQGPSLDFSGGCCRPSMLCLVLQRRNKLFWGLGLEDVFWVSNLDKETHLCLGGLCNPDQMVGWRPTWRDFGRQYKRLQLLRYSLSVLKACGSVFWFCFGLFGHVHLCLSVFIIKKWLLEIELLGDCSKDPQKDFIAATPGKKSPFKMGNINSIPFCSPPGCILQNWGTFSYEFGEKKKMVFFGNTVWQPYRLDSGAKWSEN